jgi:hypothetical protein
VIKSQVEFKFGFKPSLNSVIKSPAVQVLDLAPVATYTFDAQQCSDKTTALNSVIKSYLIARALLARALHKCTLLYRSWT